MHRFTQPFRYRTGPVGRLLTRCRRAGPDGVRPPLSGTEGRLVTVPSADPFPTLPVDPDLSSRRPRPMHLQPGLIGLVLLGGAVGAPVRYAISRAWPTATGGFPWATFVVNLIGAVALGALLEALARAGPDTGGRRAIRLLMGTGLLGAFTTYSTLAVEADLLVRAHADTRAVLYAVGSVAAGLLASLVGIVTAAGGHRALVRVRPPAPAALDRSTGGDDMAADR